MGKITGFKRALSVLLTLSLVFSSMAVVGVSAAVTGTEYHYTFDASDGYDYHANYYVNQTATETYNNCNASGVETKLVAGGYNGSDYLMKMAYTANGTTADKQHYASFSVPNNTGANKNGRNHGSTAHLEVGATFRITVTYKVTGYQSAAALYFNIGMGALSDNDLASFTGCYPTKIVDITAATDGWVQASALVQPAVKNGAYFTLKMADETNRAGTEVLIGKIDIVPTTGEVEQGTVTFDSKGGSAVSSIQGVVGSTITYPTPTRDGYTFVGWFTEGDVAAPAKFQTGTISVYAKWQQSTPTPPPTPGVNGTEYHYTFDVSDGYDYAGLYYVEQEPGKTFNNCNTASVETKLVAGGYSGSAYLMQMAYIGEGVTLDEQHYSAFSLPNNTGSKKNNRNHGQSIRLETGATFRITVKYKVTGYKSAATLYVGSGGYTLSAQKMKFSEIGAAAVANITATTADWQTAQVYYTQTAADKNLYFLLKMADDANRVGTAVQIGAIDIVPVDPSTLTTVTFDSKGGSAVADLRGEIGTDISYPTPTRDGYTFLGWFTEGDVAAPTKFQTGTISVYAKWEEKSTPTPPMPGISGTEYHYTFDVSDGYDYAGLYYVEQEPGKTFNNCNTAGVETKLVAGGYNGSAHLMQMAYTANGVTLDEQHYSAFSLPNNTGSKKNNRNHGQSIRLETGATFRITVKYKVTGYKSAATLYVGSGGYTLSAQKMKFSEIGAAAVANITATTADWQTAQVYYTQTAADKNLYFLLKMADDANREGTAVQIGAIDIVPVDPSTLATVKCNLNDGSGEISLYGDLGASVSYPTPTRDGYTFLGWFTADDGAAPTVFQAGSVTVYAKWEQDQDVPPAPIIPPPATGTQESEYHYTFDVSDGFDYKNKFYKQNGDDYTNNCIVDGVDTNLIADGYGSSAQSMQMAYTANDQTKDEQHYAAFSLPNIYTETKNGRVTGQSIKLQAGTYRITVQYKVTGYVSPTALYVGSGGYALSDMKPKFSALGAITVANITATTDWQQAQVYYTQAEGTQALLFVLKMASDANRAGTAVQVGKIDIEPVDPSTLATIKFNAKGGSTVTELRGEVGSTINYPVPTREGYDFLGWFTEDDQTAPTKFEAGVITLYAKWGESATPPEPVGTMYVYDFNTAYKNDKGTDYYTANGDNTDGNNAIDMNSGVDTRLVAGGYNNSANAMQMSYTKNADKTLDKQFYPSLSFPNTYGEAKNGRASGKSVHLETGALFRVRVTYRVTGYASAGTLYAALGNVALSDRRDGQLSFSTMNAVKIADIGATTGGWVTKEITFAPAVDANIYLMLKMADDTKRVGTKVLIGKVEFIPLPSSTITFDTDGGTYINAITGECGTTVSYPADPTKEGHKFLGWFTEDGGEKPTKFPNRNVKLIAKWLDLSVWGFEDNASGEELALNKAAGFSAKVTNENAYFGKHSLKISSANSTDVNRPQFAVYDGYLKRIKVEKEKNYTVSFRVMVPSTAGISEISYWMAATNRSGAYGASDAARCAADTFASAQSINVVEMGGYDQWFEVKYSVRNCPVAGSVVMGITGNSAAAHAFYIDDLKVAEIPYVKPEAGVWSFETEENDTLLSLNTNMSNTIRTDNSVSHTGYASARVNAADSSGDGRPQMTVRDADGKIVKIEKGKNYIISYYVMVPSSQADYKINFWFTASPDETCYQREVYSKNLHLLTEDVKSISSKGDWKKVTAVVEKSKLSGMLRLGICANAGETDGAVEFYIDDIKVEQVDSIESMVQSFEDYSDGEELDLNSDEATAIVASDAVGGNTGKMAAEIRSNTNAGNPRPQMMLKNGVGQQIQVYKGRSYEVKFYVYVPAGQPKYEISWWLAATNDTTCFSNSGPKKDDFVVAQDDDDTLNVPFGQWTEVTVNIDSCRYNGMLRFGITGTTQTPHTFYVDDISIREVKADPESKVNSFEIESYKDGADVSLNSSITVSREDSRNGITSVKVQSKGSNINAAPQMVIENFRGEDVKVELGKKYRVSFWIVVPSDEADYDIQFWLAATDSNKAFTTKLENIVAQTKTIEIANKNTWQYVSADIKNCPFSGKLRLGITGTTDEEHTFYIDDMKVEERISAEADPDAMNFENYEIGTNLAINGNDNTIIVTGDESYTGDKSVLFHSVTNGGDNRPQLNIKDGKGKQVKLEKGESYYVSFKMMVPFSEDYFNFSYWLAVVPDDKLDAPFVRESDFVKNDYVIFEKNGDEPPEAGIWKEYKIAIMNCERSGNLRVGFTHYNGDPFTSNFYIDDIKVSLPEYVLVKFDTNGSEDVYEDIYMMADMRIPTENYVDPYREGYEFMGWYTDKSFKKEFYFDIYNDLVTTEYGDVMTLYACWKKWDEIVASGNADREETTKYKTEYYTEKVWVGDQNVADPWDTGDKLNREDAAPIVVEPDQQPEDNNGGSSSSGMPPWLIVMIIVAAVIVTGGGATLAAILLKKNKKA